MHVAMLWLGHHACSEISLSQRAQQTSASFCMWIVLAGLHSITGALAKNCNSSYNKVKPTEGTIPGYFSSSDKWQDCKYSDKKNCQQILLSEVFWPTAWIYRSALKDWADPSRYPQTFKSLTHGITHVVLVLCSLMQCSEARASLRNSAVRSASLSF